MKKVALIGVETHVYEVMKLNGDVLEIVAISVPEEQKKIVESKYNVPVFTDSNEMLDKIETDIVGIFNPHNERANAVIESLLRNKNVIVDKPMAININELKRIKEILKKRRNLKILLLLTLRGNSKYIKVREIVKNGLIGEPVHCYAKMSVELKKDKRPVWFLDYRKSGGLACDLAIHSLDIMEWVTEKHFCEVISYEEKVGNFSEPYLVNASQMLLKFKEKGFGVMETNRLLPEGCGSDYRLNVVGTEGQIDMTLTGSVFLKTSKNLIKEITDLPESFSIVKNWINSIEKYEKPCITNKDSIRASLLAIKAKESAYKKKKIKIE